jgi:lysyl-tRNA synthetase class 2
MSRLGKENYCLSIKKPLGFNLLKIKNIDNFVFDKLVSTKLLQPTFVTKFPRILCPLAKLNNLNSKFVDIFELYISGKELAPGYSEQTDPFIQSKLLVKQNKFKRSLYDKKFIDNLTRGVPYMSGIGLGVNRLIMILSNSKNIRDF